MIKIENINARVQKALLRRIEAVNKLKLKGTNKDKETFFEVGNAFDIQDNNNPIEQEYFRSPWARVSLAVPNPKTDSDVIHQMISLSSYLNTDEQNQYVGALGYNGKDQNGTTNYIQGYNESENNRFRGHSGITGITANQKEFYTHSYTVNWNCPDPVYFDQVFEPAFLKLGSTILMEFGYGREFEKGTKIPQLTVEDVKDLLNPEKSKVSTRERNLIAPQNYFCAVGTVHKFDWKIDSSGGYSGDIQVISMGINPLSESSDPGDESDRTIDKRIQDIIQLNATGKQLLETGVKSDEFGETELEDVINTTNDNYNSVQTLLKAGVSFKAAVKNLDKVLDKYLLGTSNKFSTPIYYQKPDGKLNIKLESYSTILNFLIGFIPKSERTTPTIDYKFKDGAMYFNFEDSRFEENEKLKSRYLMSWGWFEDIILNSFFELKSGDLVIQQVRSVDENGMQNLCKSNDYLYSLGLDSVILPGKTHEFLDDPFDKFEDSEIVQALNNYEPETLRRLDLTRTIFKMIDEKFNPFQTDIGLQTFGAVEKMELTTIDEEMEETKTTAVFQSGDYIENPENYNTKTGIIRNMVFPIEMYQKHFESTTSLRQAMQSFWADVSGMYGGYWRFALGQEQTSDNGKIGISDIGLVDASNPNDINNETQLSDIKTNKQDQLDKVKKCFKFSLSSQDSIIKDFDISLDISAEAATLARYGSFKSRNSSKEDPSTLSDLSIEAWNILQERGEPGLLESQKATLELHKTFTKLSDSVLKDISYASDDGQGKSYKGAYNDPNDDGTRKRREVRTLGEEGIVWNKVDKIKEDLKQQIEKIEEDTVKHYKGIGMYNSSANMSSYFKQTMLYLLRTARIKGVQSSIKGQVPLPLTLSMTLDGIGGLKVGDMFKIDYLPKPYRKFTYFVIKKVDQKISTSGWSTDIEAYMQFNGAEESTQNPDRELTMNEASIKKLFEFTDLSIEEISGNLSADGMTKINNLLKQFDDGVTYIRKQIQFYRDNKDKATHQESIELTGGKVEGRLNSIKGCVKELSSLLTGPNDILETTSKKYEKIKDEVDGFLKEINNPAYVDGTGGMTGQEGQAENLKDGSGESVQAGGGDVHRQTPVVGGAPQT